MQNSPLFCAVQCQSGLLIMASPAKRLKSEEGPLPITIFVVEDVLERKYSNGGIYGTSYAASSVNQYGSISPIIIHEKHMGVLKKDKSFILMKYVTLQDGTLKIGIQSVLMHTKKPEKLKEEVVRSFQCPMTICELGRINSLNVRERVSVKGEVTKVSDVMHSNSTKRRIVTLSDGNAAIEVKLWGELVDSIVGVGSTVVVTCVHVDIYQEKRSLNSSGSTEVKIVDTEEDFSGTVNGVSFDESNLSILVDEDFMSCSSEQLKELFPESTFVENVKVRGTRRRSIIMSIEKEAVDRVGDERETKSEDGDDRLLEDVVDLMLKDDSSADI